MSDPVTLSTEVLVIGAGGAGMYAAVAAARNGARVLLIDKNVVGRGGATVMAQMTCASALGEADVDSPELHLADTLEAGRGLCNERLAALLCEGSPLRIRELDGWGVNWARADDGRFSQVKAPGHNRKRCVYVDYLATGAAICATLRNKVSRDGAIRRLSNASITDIVVREGEAAGAVGYDIPTAAPVVIRAGAIVIASGGMTKMFQRTTASNNLCGEGIGLALRAGARLTDIEFLQFYPNGHLAPRMVGLDPTTWEPTRVKLGGRLLNGNGEEFLQNYTDTQGGGAYDTARDVLTYAIYKEVEEGRGSPHGGVYLSFQHVAPEAIERALGPVLEIFARNSIDLTKAPVEIFPIAHYQMGGIEVDTTMATRVPGLYAAGEVVGGANGANRLSGNALPEALVFGERAGMSAARHAKRRAAPDWDAAIAAPYIDTIRGIAGRNAGGPAPVQMLRELKELMWTKVGAFRTAADLAAARERIRAMRLAELDTLAVAEEAAHNTSLVEWCELRNGLVAAQALALAALNRRESRGAHQRVDFPTADDAFRRSQHIALDGRELVSDLAVSDLAGAQP